MPRLLTSYSLSKLEHPSTLSGVLNKQDRISFKCTIIWQWISHDYDIMLIETELLGNASVSHNNTHRK